MSLRKLAFLVVAIAATIGLMASGGLSTAQAQQALPSFDCIGVDPEFCIFLDPAFPEPNDAGTEHTVTAFVSADFGPAVGELVAFNVTDGPNVGANATPTTNENGEASFTYTGGPNAGTDTIEACIFFLDEELCVGAQKQWREHRLSLTPVEDINLAGTAHTVTATVTDLEGTPVSPEEEIGVFIWVGAGPNEETEFFECDGVEETCLFDFTDELGQVKLTYTGDGGLGQDTIFANACIPQFECTEFLNAEATKDWVGPLTITLTPETDTNEVGTAHTVTATVVDSGGRAKDEEVTFTLTAGPNKADTGTDTTNLNGEATFTYTGDGGVGKDTIQACVFDNEAGKDVCDTAAKEWKAVVLAATATPTPTPAALPTAGGTPSDAGSSALPWLAAIAGAIALIGSGSAWLARQRRRVR